MVALPLLAAWRPGLLGAPPAACRASEGLGLGARVQGSACGRAVRDSIRCGKVKWCGCGVPWWTSGGGLVGSGPVPGGLALSAQRLSAHGLSLPYESFSVSRYFGSVWHRNQSRSRTPNCTGLETETEPKNRTTDFSVRFRFGSVFGFW